MCVAQSASAIGCRCLALKQHSVLKHWNDIASLDSARTENVNRPRPVLHANTGHEYSSLVLSDVVDQAARQRHFVRVFALPKGRELVIGPGSFWVSYSARGVRS